MSMSRNIWLGLLASLASAMVAPASAQQQQQKPNILVILGDDIGYWNISAYNRGMMGYRTPNIDRIANEGAIFTDYYGQQSCTAGRAAFITGQSPLRTGLLKVGLPGAKEGLSEKDPTHRRAAQAAGLRDRTVRQEPSRRPQRVPADRARLRRVLRQPLSPERRGRAGASGLSEEPRVQGAIRSARRAEVHRDRHRHAGRRSRASARGASRDARTPARSPRSAWRRSTRSSSTPRSTSSTAPTGTASRSSCWFNSTRMHIWTRLKPESQGKTGLGIYPDGMVEHDGQVGQLLKKLDDLGIANNTIVI